MDRGDGANEEVAIQPVAVGRLVACGRRFQHRDCPFELGVVYDRRGDVARVKQLGNGFITGRGVVGVEAEHRLGSLARGNSSCSAGASGYVSELTTSDSDEVPPRRRCARRTPKPPADGAGERPYKPYEPPADRAPGDKPLFRI